MSGTEPSRPERNHADRYVQPRRCSCGSTRVFGETGWRLCTDCGWDELKDKR